VSEEPRPPDPKRICEVIARTRVEVSGRIRRVTACRRGPSVSCQMELDDGSGLLHLVFFGRRAVPGLTAGRWVTVRGTAGAEGGRLVLWNPRYELCCDPTEAERDRAPGRRAAPAVGAATPGGVAMSRDLVAALLIVDAAALALAFAASGAELTLDVLDGRDPLGYPLGLQAAELVGDAPSASSDTVDFRLRSPGAGARRLHLDGPCGERAARCRGAFPLVFCPEVRGSSALYGPGLCLTGRVDRELPPGRGDGDGAGEPW